MWKNLLYANEHVCQSAARRVGRLRPLDWPLAWPVRARARPAQLFALGQSAPATRVCVCVCALTFWPADQAAGRKTSQQAGELLVALGAHNRGLANLLRVQGATNERPGGARARNTMSNGGRTGRPDAECERIQTSATITLVVKVIFSLSLFLGLAERRTQLARVTTIGLQWPRCGCSKSCTERRLPANRLAAPSRPVAGH